MIITTENVWQEFNIKLKQFIIKRVHDEQSAEKIRIFQGWGVAQLNEFRPYHVLVRLRFSYAPAIY
jgi:hypothetical protein